MIESGGKVSAKSEKFLRKSYVIFEVVPASCSRQTPKRLTNNY